METISYNQYVNYNTIVSSMELVQPVDDLGHQLVAAPKGWLMLVDMGYQWWLMND